MVKFIIKHIPSNDEKEKTSFFRLVVMIATIVIESGEFSITLNDVRLISNDKKHFNIGLPSYKTKNNRKERYYPTTNEFKSILENGLIQLYQHYLDTGLKSYIIDSYTIEPSINVFLRYQPTDIDKETNKYLKDALGIFSISIGDVLILNDVILIKSDKYYIGFPSYRKLNKKYNDIFHSNNNFTRNLIQNSILDAYNKKTPKE